MANVLNFSFSFTTSIQGQCFVQDNDVEMRVGPYATRFYRIESINCGEDQNDGGVVLDFRDLTGSN